MRSDIIALYVFLVSVAVFACVSAIVRTHLDKKNGTKQEQKEHQEQQTVQKITNDEQKVKDFERDCTRKLSTDIILSKIKQRLMRHLIKRNGSEALICVDEAMGVTNPELDAIERHFFLTDVIDLFYSLRDQDEEAYFACINVFQYEIDNIENLVKKMGSPFNMTSASRVCIIMEKLGMYEEAIQICDICAGYNLFESGHKSFLIRKERLMKKMIRDGRG